MSVFDRIVGAGEECSAAILKALGDIVEKAGVETDYGRGEVLDTLNYTFSRDIPDLELPNEDWDWHAKTGRLRREYSHIMDRVKEGLIYECDRIWGFEEPLREAIPPRPEAESAEEKAKRIAMALLEPFARAKEEFFRRIGDEARYREREACRRAVAIALTRFDACMKERVPELRGAKWDPPENKEEIEEERKRLEEEIRRLEEELGRLRERLG